LQLRAGMRKTLVIGPLLVVALILGCISSKPKAMEVELGLIRFKLDAETLDQDRNVRMTVNISAKNSGDPGNVTLVVKMLDDEGNTLATKQETFHLDSGEERIVTVVIEKTLPIDFDWEVVHPAISKPTTEPD